MAVRSSRDTVARRGREGGVRLLRPCSSLVRWRGGLASARRYRLGHRLRGRSRCRRDRHYPAVRFRRGRLRRLPHTLHHRLEWCRRHPHLRLTRPCLHQTQLKWLWISTKLKSTWRRTASWPHTRGRTRLTPSSKKWTRKLLNAQLRAARSSARSCPSHCECSAKYPPATAQVSVARLPFQLRVVQSQPLPLQFLVPPALHHLRLLQDLQPHQ